MPLEVCAPQQFVGTQQFEVPFGTAIAQLARDAHIPPATWRLDICQRPFLPLYGVKQRADGTYEFLPSTTGHTAALLEIGRSSYLASKNYAIDDLVAPQQYLPVSGGSNYGTYLWSKIANIQCKLDRYLEQFNKISQFMLLDAANLAAWNILAMKEINTFIQQTIPILDKSLFIPPTSYLFKSPDPANLAIEAWFVADNTLSALFGLELIVT